MLHRVSTAVMGSNGQQWAAMQHALDAHSPPAIPHALRLAQPATACKRATEHCRKHCTHLLPQAGDGSAYVLRKKPPGRILASAHAVRVQARRQAAGFGWRTAALSSLLQSWADGAATLLSDGCCPQCRWSADIECWQLWMVGCQWHFQSDLPIAVAFYACRWSASIACWQRCRPRLCPCRVW